MKTKKPLFAIWNDIHLGVGNCQELLISTRHMVDYLLQNDIKVLINNGDFFHSRSNQTQEVLTTANEILKIINDAGVRHIINVGNHDRQSYFKPESFLDSFRFHPGVEIYDGIITTLEISGVNVSLSPFFDDSILVPMLEEVDGGDILLGHWEMLGSSHLGRVSEKTTITPKLLKKFKKVYLAHYHNHQEITKDIVHLPSLRQNSFGEDDNKGFTIINEDLSYTIIPGVFKKFNKFVLNIDELTVEDIKELITIHSDSEDTVRFEFIGEETKLRSLDKEQFQGTGIDVKIKYQKKYQEKDVEKPVLIKKFEKNQIENLFKEFCEEKDYSYTEGVVMLNEFLNKN
jgi:exonuclease SbcD